MRFCASGICCFVLCEMSTSANFFGTSADLPALALLGGSREVGGYAGRAGCQCAGRILGLQAKAEYNHQIDDLRSDLKEAERFNSFYRAAMIRSEIDVIAGPARRCHRTRRSRAALFVQRRADAFGRHQADQRRPIN
jgi:hypothetical protein